MKDLKRKGFEVYGVIIGSGCSLDNGEDIEGG